MTARSDPVADRQRRPREWRRAQLVRFLESDSKGHLNWSRMLQGQVPHAGGYFVYVIDVEPLSRFGDYDFYVGSTGKTVQERFADHAAGGAYAAAIFRHDQKFPAGRARPVRLCPELMLGTPPFPNRAAAVRAEGILARRIAACGYRVRSDALTK